MGWIFYFYFFEIGLGLNTYGFVGGLGWDFGEFLSVGLGWVFFKFFYYFYYLFFRRRRRRRRRGILGVGF